jgi:predicted alpha/beta-fold hydrolase
MTRSPFVSFRPHSLFVGGHAQTLAGAYLPWPYRPYGAVRHHVALEDGDQLVLHDDRPSSWHEGGPACVLIHGLAGCHESGYMRRIASKLSDRGVRVFRMDMRGCGAGEELARGTTHCGRWADAAAAIEFVARDAPASPTALVGFSLGGTIALNMAGELGAGACGNLVGVFAVCSPIDLHSVRRRFDAPAGRAYDRHFVGALWQKSLERMRERDEMKAVDWSRPPRRLREFDAIITAPLAGYASVDDYYTRTSPGPRLAAIRVPTTILAAADDPVVPSEPLLQVARNDAVEVFITRHGGHLGYVGRRNGDPDRRWLDWRVVYWVETVCKSRVLCHVRSM